MAKSDLPAANEDIPAAEPKKASKANEPLLLVCPIRGLLKNVGKKSSDLSSLEERHRIDAIRHLLSLGYDKNKILIEAVIAKFGADGKNSFRCDFAVLDVPVGSVPPGSAKTEFVLQHALVLCEVKRDNAKFDYVKQTQVEPMLKFAPNKNTLGLYWDATERRVFWKEQKGNSYTIESGPLALLPKPGFKISVKPLLFKDIDPPATIVELFKRIEDVLHGAQISLEERYETILQILLARIFDEHQSESDHSRPLAFQDFASLGVSDSQAGNQLNAILEDAVSYYGSHLPKSVESQFNVPDHVLSVCARLVAPFKLTQARKEVMQTFYMSFAKDLYRWDLAQYFTPPTVTDFIIEVLNPVSGESIKDPACGSADFLVATFHRNRQKKMLHPADGIFGADNDPKAVQISVLNMLLNGDGKTNIVKEDSLQAVAEDREKLAKNKKHKITQYNVVVCNPPFGLKIVERRASVLKQFDLGHVWERGAGGKWQPSHEMLTQQETGLLFAEVCVRMVKPGGRIGIVVPTGYLGNRSDRYVAFREWLFRQCRVVSVCAFPRFTFKTSGADVSASVAFLEKRKTPIADSSMDGDYVFNAELIDSVGWNVSDQKALPIYERAPEDGAYLTDETGEKRIKSDFASVLTDIRTSQAISEFPWLVKGLKLPDEGNAPLGWAVPISMVLDDPALTLDPKRHSRKFLSLVSEIEAAPHIRLTDVFEVVSETKAADGKAFKPVPTELYQYAEIEHMGGGDYRAYPKRGWELPNRAKHLAAGGDVFLCGIWSSVNKWCLIEDAPPPNLVVTNGCHRLKVKPGMDKYLLDAIAFFCSETYTTQMRALARGSDGLAEINAADLGEVLIPRVVDSERREVLEPYLKAMKAGGPTLKAQVEGLMSVASPLFPLPARRPHHACMV
jgi:type I restriction enzyme M protein